MHGLLKSFAPIFCLLLLPGCGGGGGSQTPVPPPPPSNARPALRLDAANYTLAIRTSIGTTFNAFNFVKLGGDLAELMLDLPTPVTPVLLPCPDGGSALLTMGDRNGDGVFNVGDYVNQAYDDCANQFSSTDGIIRIVLDGVLPRDGGREIRVTTTLVNFKLTPPGRDLPSITSNFVGPGVFTRTPEYREYRLAGATFSSSQLVVGATDVSALAVIYLQNYATGRYSLTFGGTLDSAMFAGPFDYATFAPLTGTIGQHPTAGRLDVIGGAGSSARLSEEGAAAGNDATVLMAVDANGDGNADASIADYAWSEVLPRQLFDRFADPVVVTIP